MNTPSLTRFKNPVQDERDEDKQYEIECEKADHDRDCELRDFWIASETETIN